MFVSLTDRCPRRWAFLIGLLVPILLSGGCGKGRERQPVYPVRGQVFIQGQPAAEAFVVFHPVKDDGAQALRPYGYVSADGSFTLTTYEQGDGAPSGEYGVAIVWPEGEEGHDRLNGRYMDPKKTKLRAEVKNGPTELAPFRLSR